MEESDGLIYIFLGLLVLGFVFIAIFVSQEGYFRRSPPPPIPEDPAVYISPEPTKTIKKICPEILSEGTHSAVKGESLWEVAAGVFGDPSRWPELKEYNQLSVSTLLHRQEIKYPNQGSLTTGKPVIFEQGQVVYKDYHQIYVSCNITDGNDLTVWRTQTDFSGPSRAMAVIDLLGSYRIDRISYLLSWDRKEQFDDELAIKISYSNQEPVSFQDSQAWIELETRYLTRTQAGHFVLAAFPPVEASYLKIEYVDEDEKWGGWGNIAEVRAFEAI